MTMPGEVDVAQVELLLEDERQQQVERPLEGVEVELELPDDHARDPSARYRTRPFGTAMRGPVGTGRGCFCSGFSELLGRGRGRTATR